MSDSSVSSGDSSALDDGDLLFANEDAPVDVHPFYDEAREVHERSCREGDGWSHAFRVRAEDLSQIESIQVRDVYLFTRQGRLARHILKNHFTAENWGRAGEAASQSSALRVINFTECGLGGEFPAAFFGDRIYRSEVELELFLSGNDMGPTGMAGLLPFLKARSALKTLVLDDNDLRAEGVRLLSEALDHVCIGSLTVYDNGFVGDEGIEQLLSARNSVHLEELYLGPNDEDDAPSIGTRGATAISQFLRRDETELKRLDVNCRDDDLAQLLVEAASKNINMRKLLGMIGSGSSTQLMKIKEAAMCNLSSVEAVCQSNHHLMMIGDAAERSPALQCALLINAQGGTVSPWSEVKRIRAKLRDMYLKGNFSVGQFEEIDVKLMPRVFGLLTQPAEWCGGEHVYDRYESRSRNQDLLSGVFRLVRNCHLPELVGFPSPEGQIRDLKKKNAALEDEVAALKERNAALEQMVAALPNKRAKVGEA